MAFQRYNYRSLCLAGLVLACSTAGWQVPAVLAEPKPTTQPLLSSKNLAGKTLVVSSARGDVSVRFAANGTMTGTAKSSVAADDQGRWWISEQNLCLQWQSWLENKRHCFTVEPLPGPVMRWRADSGEEGIAYFADAVSAAR